MKFPPRRSQNQEWTSINFVPTGRSRTCAETFFASRFVKQEVGILYPGKAAPWFTNLLHPIMRIVFHAPDPDSIRLNAFDSPKEKATLASSQFGVGQVPRVRRPVYVSSILCAEKPLSVSSLKVEQHVVLAIIETQPFSVRRPGWVPSLPNIRALPSRQIIDSDCLSSGIDKFSLRGKALHGKLAFGLDLLSFARPVIPQPNRVLEKNRISSFRRGALRGVKFLSVSHLGPLLSAVLHGDNINPPSPPVDQGIPQRVLLFPQFDAEGLLCVPGVQRKDSKKAEQHHEYEVFHITQYTTSSRNPAKFSLSEIRAYQSPLSAKLASHA